MEQAFYANSLGKRMNLSPFSLNTTMGKKKKTVKFDSLVFTRRQPILEENSDF